MDSPLPFAQYGVGIYSENPSVESPITHSLATVNQELTTQTHNLFIDACEMIVYKSKYYKYLRFTVLKLTSYLLSYEHRANFDETSLRFVHF